MNFAFYGQAIIKNGRRGASLIRAQQLAHANTRIARHGGQIVADYFDVYPDRLWSWRHRRQAHLLLRAIADPQRSFDAVVIGNTDTALTALQYDDLLELCTQHGVHLWLPEIDGPVDPDNNEHHEIIKEKLWGTFPPLRNTTTQMLTEQAAVTPDTAPDRGVATTSPPPTPTQRRPASGTDPNPPADAAATRADDSS